MHSKAGLPLGSCLHASRLVTPCASNAEEAGVHSKAGLFLEVASVFPIMMGAAFTQNNINTVVSSVLKTG